MSTEVKIPQALTQEHGQNRQGREAAHLHGQPCHHADGSARAGRHAALLHREVRQCRQPQPLLWMGRGRGR